MDLKRLTAATLQARVWVALLGTALLTAGCILRTPALLKAANKPPEQGPTRRRLTVERIERIVRAHMVDGYVDWKTVTPWLDAMAEDPTPIIDLLHGLADPSERDPSRLYEKFNLRVSPTLTVGKGHMASAPTSVWDIPAPPLSTENGIIGLGPLASPLENERNKETVGRELDAERFTSNARATASSLLVLENLAGVCPLSRDDLRAGIRRGAGLAKGYLRARGWHRRVGRPTTAIVISGGAANGAFSAGFVWRLTGVLQACSANHSCPNAGIDLAIGTSSGSLIGVMLDIFSTSGQEKRGRDLLLRNYTCSTAADVYCVNDVWDWKLLQDTRGLVRFDPLRSKLNQMLTDAQRDNAMELVTMTVDYQTGDLLAESDQDPADRLTTVPDRVDAVLASSVEPVMADPIERPERPEQPERPGTFIDGGVRSGTPAMEASRRGAERVLVVKSASLDSDIQPRQPHALKMLARTIELFVDQVGATEIQQATLFATARRLGEFNLCEYRLQAAGSGADENGPGNPDDREVRKILKEKGRFCRRESLVPDDTLRRAHVNDALATSRALEPAFLGPQPAFLGPDVFAQVAQSVRSAWIVRPEGAEAATGYDVDPKVMQGLFVRGIETFQARCPEVLRLLEIPESVRKIQCTPEAGTSALDEANSEIAKCTAKAKGARPCKS